ncbi:MAG: TRAP transporter small permease [Rhodospirillales bacterium]
MTDDSSAARAQRTAFTAGFARFDAVYGGIEAAFNLIAATAIFLMMMLMVAEVVAHKLLRTSIYGFFDVVELGMAVFAFLGAAYCQRLGGHIRMDLLVTKLQGRAKFVVEAVAVLVALIVVALLIKATWEHAMRAYFGNDTTSDAELQTWPSKILAPIGLGMLWLRLLLQFIGFIRLAADPDAVPIGVPRPVEIQEDAVD